MKIAEPALFSADLARLAEKRSLRQADSQRMARRCRLLGRPPVKQVKELVNVLGDAEAQRRQVDEAADKIPELDIPPVGSSFMTTFDKSVLFTMWLGCLRPPAAMECEG